MIRIENIGKCFDELWALEGIDLCIDRGELFGVIGPDGAGKTTLFRIIASLITPDRGTCRLAGYDVVKDYRKVRERIGYMPGRFSLYLDLTVEENLAFYARIFGSSIAANFELIRDVYQHIEPFKKRLAGKLSGGMKQKLALSCALIHRPSVLLLDEPTTGVDAVSRREFWDMLQKIKKEGITVLVSTPYMDEAARCNRVALLAKGRVLDVGDPRQIGAGELPMFCLRASRGIYPLLKQVRELDGCKSAWLFGDCMHITALSHEAAPGLETALRSLVCDGLRVEAMESGIEDRFIALSMG